MYGHNATVPRSKTLFVRACERICTILITKVKLMTKRVTKTKLTMSTQTPTLGFVETGTFCNFGIPLYKFHILLFEI